VRFRQSALVAEMQRLQGWVADEDAAVERRQHAQRLVGSTVVGVRYFDFDYEKEGPEGQRGPRLVVDDLEWQPPCWYYDNCDDFHYGLEMTTSGGRMFSVTWDSGDHDSLGLREEPLYGPRFEPTHEAALWDVGERSRWQRFLNDRVRAVQLHYRPCATGGLWCPRITLEFGVGGIELLLAQGSDYDGVIREAPNNIVVLFNPASLPSWAESF